MGHALLLLTCDVVITTLSVNVTSYFIQKRAPYSADKNDMLHNYSIRTRIWQFYHYPSLFPNADNKFLDEHCWKDPLGKEFKMMKEDWMTDWRA